ncbi:MAG: sortase, partial [Chloroflexi bacterium]|nr:sortase [Chloroflexota bacterium]
DIPHQSVPEGGPFTTINLDNYVSDPDHTDAQMTWTYAGNVELTVSIDASRVATIGIPSADWYGSETITFTAADPGGLSAGDPATFTVNAVNNPPFFIMGGDQTVAEDSGAQTISIWATSISVGPPNESWQTPTFQVTNDNNALFSAQPAINANGDLTYTPAANAHGAATVTVVLRDDGGTANGGVDTYAPSPNTFTITVTPVNDPPFFSSAPLTSVMQNDPYAYNIVTDDPDAADTLTITAPTLPSWLSFVDNGNRTAALSGTPTNADIGAHLVVLRVSDGTAVPVEQSFTINVTDVNDAPSFTSAPVTAAGESVPYVYNITTTDPDAADTLTITATAPLPAWLTLTDNGDRTATLSGTPNSSQVGVYNIALQVSDGTLTDDQTFDITVGNTAPQVISNGVNTVADTGDGVLNDFEVVGVGITQILVRFNQDVYAGGGPNDVTNPANYMLVRDNGDGFQTTACNTGVSAQDTAITINSVTYANGGGAGPFVSTLSINSGLPLSNGNYRLFVCGTTSIVDIVDNNLRLAGDGTTPGTDFIRNFTVFINNNGNTGGNTGGGGNGGGRGARVNAASLAGGGVLIPVTGFAPNQFTLLPAQPADKAYKPMNGMRIEIPTLGINFPIVGAPLTENGWDLTWLQDGVAYLEGSAYPTWSGNTVLTAHVVNADNNLGPFSDIKGLRKGDFIYLHAGGQTFVYQIQENRKISPLNVSAVFKHQEYDWVTLVTCEDYNKQNGAYQYRRMVRAVLISVIPQK